MRNCRKVNFKAREEKSYESKMTKKARLNSNRKEIMIEELLEFERIDLFATKIDKTQFESFVSNLLYHIAHRSHRLFHSHRRFSWQELHEEIHRRSKTRCDVAKYRLYWFFESINSHWLDDFVTIFLRFNFARHEKRSKNIATTYNMIVNKVSIINRYRCFESKNLAQLIDFFSSFRAL